MESTIVGWIANHFFNADGAVVLLIANSIFKYLPVHGHNDMFQVVVKTSLRVTISVCTNILNLMEKPPETPYAVLGVSYRSISEGGTGSPTPPRPTTSSGDTMVGNSPPGSEYDLDHPCDR